MNLPVKAAVLLGLSLGLVWGCAGGEAKAAGLGPDDTGVAALLLSPSVPIVDAGQAVIIRATGRTVTGGMAPVSVQWTATGGSIVPVSDSEAEFSSATAGTFWVRAQESSAPAVIDSTSIVVVIPESPTVGILVIPASVMMNTGESRQFSALATREDGSTYTPGVVWSATGGSITASGLYSAGNSAGTYRVIAREQGGTLADTATITLAVPPPVLQAVILTPSSVSLNTGATQQFSVSGQWSDGGTSAPSVTYSATGGSITSNGLFTAGGTPGTYRVIARQQGGTLADTASATITAPPPTGTACLAGVAGSYPNEPAGLTRVFEHEFEAVPNGGNGAAGTNWLVEDGASLLSLVAEPAGPGIDASCMRTRFPGGLSSGDAPVTLTVDMTDGGSARRTKQYFSLWFMIEGPNFENQAVGTKFGFFGYGDSDSGPLNQGFLILRGSGTQQTMSSMSLEFWQQAPGPVSDRTLERNVGSGNAVTVGAWHHLELVMIENALGSSNGEFHMWVDGVKTHQYTNVVFRNSSYPLGFRGWKWNPTWGGIGGTKTRDDFVRFAHVYLSGS